MLNYDRNLSQKLPFLEVDYIFNAICVAMSNGWLVVLVLLLMLFVGSKYLFVEL